MVDERIPYSVKCTWWDGIDKVGTKEREGYRLPCCPHCGSMLFEMPDEKTWFDQVDKYETMGHPGYRKMVEWGRGKCFPNYKALEEAYKRENLQ